MKKLVAGLVLSLASLSVSAGDLDVITKGVKDCVAQNVGSCVVSINVNVGAITKAYGSLAARRGARAINPQVVRVGLSVVEIRWTNHGGMLRKVTLHENGRGH